MSESFTAAVKHYYEVNTLRFARHDSGGTDAVRRAVWGPGVSSPQESFNFVNRMILDEFRPLRPSRLLDLGCGIGGSLFFLCGSLSVAGVGVSLSAEQVKLARQRARQLDLDDRCSFLEADYLHLPPMEPVEAAFAIESFVHCAAAPDFFRSVGSVLPKGGRLIICDDFLTEKGAGELTPGQARLLNEFKRGWHVGSLITVEQARSLAGEAGFHLHKCEDLTPFLRLGGTWDRFITWSVMMGRRLPLKSPWWDSWVGGSAIQKCLKNGLAEYRLLVFERGAHKTTE